MEDRLTFIDFETTGFKQNRAVSLALVHYEGGVRKFEKYYMVNPGAPIEEGARRIHGISFSEVADKPRFHEIWQEIRPYIEGNLVVAHNANFDIGVLKGEMERYNLECGPFKYFCTCNNARTLHLPTINYKLDTLSRYFNINLKNHHNALADTIACEKIYFNLLKMGSSFSYTSFMGKKERDCI